MNARPRQPVIGVTLDNEPAGGYSKFPWYALRQNYTAALAATGALAVALPHEVAAADSYLDLIDGLMITGGAFDVDPALFGDASRHRTVSTKDRRTGFETAITGGAIARDKPVLGICGGAQLLNVVLGGSLIQHIPDAVSDGLAHEQPNPRDQPGHGVAITPGTLLHRIVGVERLEVNSAHHQAVRTPAPRSVVNAVAADGVIEGIEARSHRFCLGVQWHPEFVLSEGDGKIFGAFVAACRT
ncbi:MAG: gamma-glutamyl-gamma-aminobutyrate hydrolase family protein [Alphaproteobacteria bacterium]|jgi:putative glutamine amidotransferase|nr:gamma-glutamyl-gamma-aminobutyrate hydrolase family protein [Alphaproteobacteria bacterium]